MQSSQPSWAVRLRLPFVLTVAVLLAWLAIRLAPVLYPAYLGMVLAFALDAPVTALEGRGISRSMGVLVIMAVFSIAILVFGFYAAPILAAEITDLATRFPSYIQGVQVFVFQTAIPWLNQHLRLHIPENINELQELLGDDIKQSVSDLLSVSGAGVGAAARGAFGVVGTVFQLALTPLFMFFFLRDFAEIKGKVVELVPPRYRNKTQDIGHEVLDALSGYFRGMFLVAVCLAFIYSIGLSIVGLKMAMLIGILTGMMYFIPYVGVAIGLILSLLMCVIHPNGWGQVIGVLAVFGVAQVVEGFFLTPRLVGNRIGLSDWQAILAVFSFGALLGFVGVVIALPVTAVAKILVKRLFAAYRASDLFDETEDSDPAGWLLPPPRRNTQTFVRTPSPDAPSGAAPAADAPPPAVESGQPPAPGAETPASAAGESSSQNAPGGTPPLVQPHRTGG
ncbi:MAG: hypothetical protein GMKNLPBB_03367 [Myxococcota bacterium]|nr:hypothetical protein [Myxococcota bacterium]